MRATTSWISKVDCYLRLRELDSACVSVRYEDLVAEPERVMRALLAAYSLTASDMGSLLSVFARDSQGETPLKRSESSHPLDDRTRRALTRVLQSQGSPFADEILPGTLSTAPSSGPVGA
jgi:hypothetical protein